MWTLKEELSSSSANGLTCWTWGRHSPRGSSGTHTIFVFHTRVSDTVSGRTTTKPQHSHRGRLIKGEHDSVAERFLCTLKEQFLRGWTFHPIMELRHAIQGWLVTYNEQWLVERHGFCAPAKVWRSAGDRGGGVNIPQPLSRKSGAVHIPQLKAL
jgi:hypothetical protein